jgi:6-phosphogluconolactonase
MSNKEDRDLRVFPNLNRFSRAAAEELVSIGQAAVDDHDRFTIALSGGSTPRTLYELLASDFRAVMPWRKTQVFLGDERYVAPGDPRSNYHMIRETLLDDTTIPRDHIHPVPTLEAEIEEVAEAYEQELMGYFPGQWPRFDLILLGMGPDGHTASLFPDNIVLEEEARVVAAVHEERADPPLRLTLTIPAINHAANVHFLIAGANKTSALARALSPNANPKSSPAAAIRPIDGHLVWWVDEAAAGQL